MSYKFDSLPPDLKAIAQGMLDEKFPELEKDIYVEFSRTESKTDSKFGLTLDELSKTVDNFKHASNEPIRYYRDGDFGTPWGVLQTIRLNFRGGSGKIYSAHMRADEVGRPGSIRTARVKLETYAREQIAFIGNEEEFERQYAPRDYAREESDRMATLRYMMDSSMITTVEAARNIQKVLGVQIH